MSIQYNEKRKSFLLMTEKSAYQMKVDEYGFLLHLYYGKRTKASAEFVLQFADRGFSGNPYDVGSDRTYSMDVLPQEFPCRGNGDYRNTSLLVENGDGSTGCDLRYVSHQIHSGKYSLPGMPAVYANTDEADTLEIVLKDKISDIEVTILYGVLPECDVITRSVLVKNMGQDRIYVTKAAAACLDFVTGDFDVISFYGRHAMERNFERTHVGHHTVSIGSRRGISSHHYNPMMILADVETTEDVGSCYAMSLLYSGGFEGTVEKDQANQTRMILGLQSEQLRYPVKPGDIFVVPEVMLSYSREGLNGLSYNLHRCIRKHVCRGRFQFGERPILINSWEASYFDIDGDKLFRLAKDAVELGINMLVMDDGWFGNRDDDNRGLGDWFVNEEKLGMPLCELIDKVNGLGMKFGIWFEPEAVSEDSELYRKHPDWVMAVPGRDPVRARYQLILDFSRKEVVDAVYEQMCDILEHNHIEYIKWDMNRGIYDVYSHTADEQGKVLYDYVLGLYDFLERINTNYPHVLIEGCSGGGGRFDAGMLYYTPQIWCSDNTDAIDRLRIQYGTSFGYPISAVGSHVSASPNHQTGRSTSFDTRGVVAMSGTFGYELDLTKISDTEKDKIREQVECYKKLKPLICEGRYYRLTNPFADETAAWQFVSEDKREVLFNAVQLEIHGNMTPIYVRLKGLEEGAVYREEKTGKLYAAEILTEIGLPLPSGMQEYRHYQMKFVKE
ncbi:MAG: alpha-galactosidase [Lachnospiraceae bacterium]|nr:alpha-galactosidase [Lachnospiraceae bacterium]